MDLVRTTAPTVPAISVDEAKAHLRVETDDADGLIGDMIDAVTAALDGYAGQLGRCLVQQTWKLRFDYAFPGWRIALPLPPLISVDAIEYVDFAGVTQTLDPTTYVVLDGTVAAVQPAYGRAWPSPRSQARAVTITFKAGYGATADAVPPPILAAMKLMIGDLYANREAVVIDASRVTMIVNPTAAALLAPYRARQQA